MNKNYRLSNYVIVTDIIDAEISSDPSRILFATRTGQSIVIKDRMYQALREGDFSLIQDKHLIRLIQLEAIVPQDQDEFDIVLKQNIATLSDGDSLDVTVQPTANCQLGCNYCGQVHSKKTVDDDTSLKITNRIIANLKNKGYKKLSVGWFGAEPLMAHNEILRMSDRLLEYCDQNGVLYRANMITNGVNFKPSIFLKLIEKKVNEFQITLDGLGETHDLMRITKEGKKTFDIIFKNIIEVTNLPEYKDSGSVITVRVNVSKNSAKTITKLIDHLAKFELGKKNVYLSFAPLFDWGGNGANKEGLSREDFANAEIDWLLHAIKKGFNVGNVTPKRSSAPCMVVKEDSEVYDAMGNIYPCYEFPYTPKYETDEYKIGHVDTIDVKKNSNAVTRNWNQDVKTDISPCKTCSLYPVCGGACPKQWYNNEIACPSFKLNIEDKLILTYLMKKDEMLNEYLNDAVLP